MDFSKCLITCQNHELTALNRKSTISTSPSSEGQVAQLVEQWTENPCVGGSTPPLTTSQEREQHSLPGGTSIKSNEKMPQFGVSTFGFPNPVIVAALRYYFPSLTKSRSSFDSFSIGTSIRVPSCFSSVTLSPEISIIRAVTSNFPDSSRNFR